MEFSHARRPGFRATFLKRKKIYIYINIFHLLRLVTNTKDEFILYHKKFFLKVFILKFLEKLFASISFLLGYPIIQRTKSVSSINLIL